MKINHHVSASTATLDIGLLVLSAALVACGQPHASSKSTSDASAPRHDTGNRPAVGAPEQSSIASPDTRASHSVSASAGYDQVHPSDEYAAHPRDPDRMAPGVALEKIVPRLALRHCEQAVKDYPNTPRFHYQLGRAYEASGRNEEAVKSYLKADAMGYRMAAFNLGWSYADGKGVPEDAAKAEQYFRKASKSGVDATEALAQFVFSSKGYSNPEFFEAAYRGKWKEAHPGALAAYLTQFLGLFRNTEDCQSVVSSYAYAKIAEHGQMNVLGRMLGGMASARNRHTPGDFSGAAKAGYETGREFQLDVAMQVDKARADAQLFYDRHGCSSPVAKQFFKNIEDYCARLGSASFRREVERNYRR